MRVETPEVAEFEQIAKQLLAGAQPVEVLALTPDAGLLAILREAAGGEQRIWHAATREQTAELLMSGQVGVIVIDTLATGEDSASYCDQIRAQFPDLILIVAGTTEDQNELVKYITAGDVYRFLHKPVSPPRARHAIDAAIRRYIEGRTIAAAEAEPKEERNNKPLYIGIGAAAVLVVAGIATAVLWNGEPDVGTAPLRQAASTPSATVAPDSAPVDASDERGGWLAAAQAAVAADKLTAADGEGAADYYQRVLARYPDDREAIAGLDRIADQLLTSAEDALLDARLDDAARDIEAARTVRPNNMRLAFLSSQLGKERERQLIAMAREAATSGDYARSRSLLERATQGQKTQSPALQEARRELERHRVGDNVESLLRSAGERMQQGKLVEPEKDNAKSFVLAALAADPGNTTAQQLRRGLADQTLRKSRQAIAQRDFVAAESWLKHAESLGANVRPAQRELQAALPSNARSEGQAQLVALLNERITQSRLLTPAQDSAKHYWLQLKAADPTNEQLQPALQTLGSRLTQQAQVELLGRQLDAAHATIAEAKALGYSSSELTELDLQVTAQRERAAFLADVVLANTLALNKYVAPRFPPAALRKGVEGWVDLDFTVAADGSVKDIEVRGAQPAGVFDQSATRAVAQWRYTPLQRNGRPVEQRARLRMKFELEDE